MENLAFFLVLVSAFVTQCSGLHLRAYFDQADVRGWVQFGDMVASSNIKIEFNLKAGLRAYTNTAFRITANPSVYDEWCKNIGAVVHDLSANHGTLQHNSQFITNHVSVKGINSLFGKSVVIYENNNVIACATILPHSDVIYAKAEFNSPELGGSFTFIQSVNGGDTFIYGAMQHSSTISNNVYDVFISADTATHASCIPFNQIYNPKEVSGVCSRLQPSSCKIGDLSAKNGPVSLTNGVGLIAQVDTDAPLSGVYSILSRSIVIRRRNAASRVNIACAKIQIAGPLLAVSTFSVDKHKGMSGHLKFEQQSPYHFTSVGIELQGLNSRVNGYHIHQFSISDPMNPCSKGSVGGHVNTWKVDISTSPKAGTDASLDKYEVGDLSGRYGGLRGKDTFSLNKMDANIPLFGLYSILGRSIVFHEDKDKNPRFVCADIEPDAYKTKVKTSVVLKDGNNNAVGRATGLQWVQINGITTRTVLIVDIPKADTTGHKWSIRTNSVDGKSCPGYLSTANPLFKPVLSSKTSLCNKRNPFGCNIGDLTGKVGTYDRTKGKTFFSDENLPMLTGPTTVIGRSLVIYKAGGSNVPLACGNIIPDNGKVTSFISFQVKNPGLGNNKALKNMLVTGMGLPANQEYRINSLTTSSLASDDDRDCFNVSFYMIDTNEIPNAAAYECTVDQILNTHNKPSSFGKCEARSHGRQIVPSLFFLVALICSLSSAYL